MCAVVERSIVMSVSVCLSVCLSVYLSVCLSASEHISGTGCPNFARFSVLIASGRGSVLLWRRCDMLCFRFCGWRHVFPQRVLWPRWGVSSKWLTRASVEPWSASDVYEWLVPAADASNSISGWRIQWFSVAFVRMGDSFAGWKRWRASGVCCHYSAR